jgi:hypothetical protein
VDFRLPHALLEGGWWLEDQSPFSIPKNGNSFFLRSTLLSGNHIASINQVRGNWDGYFSDQLGAQQLFVQSAITAQSGPLDLNIIWQANEVVRYGLLKNLTIGSAYLLTTREQFQPEHDLRINATLFHVPLREKGPSEVSKFEYEYGYQLKPGEYKINVVYKVPTSFRKRQNQWYYQSYYGIGEAEPAQAGSLFDNRNFFFDRISSTLSQTDYHFSLKASAGLGPAFIITNDLGLSKDFYDTQPIIIYPYDTIKPPSSVFVYSNTLSITVPLIADRSALSFAFACIGNTDPNLSGTRRFSYLGSFGYFHAF